MEYDSLIVCLFKYLACGEFLNKSTNDENSFPILFLTALFQGKLQYNTFLEFDFLGLLLFCLGMYVISKLW